MQESSPRSLGLQIPTPSSESHSGRVSNTSLLQQYLDTSASDPSDHSQTFETKDEPEPEARASGASPTREQDPRQLKRRSTGSRTLRPEDIQPQSPSVHQDAGHTRRSSTSSSVDLGARGLWQGTTVAPPPPEDEEHPQYPPASRPYDLANSYSLEDIQLSGDSKTSLDQSTASQQPYVSYTPPYKQYRAQQGVSLQQNAQAGPSGLQRSSTLLQRTGQALRRASVRVVNLGGQDHEAMSAAAVHENELYDQQQQRRRRRRSQQHQQEWPPREEDVESDAGFSLDEQGQQPKATLHHDLAAKTVNQPGWPPDTLPSPPPHVQTVAPQHMLMGRTLNMFGPTHPVRKMALKLMLNWWIEPLILLLIIANVVVLTIQAAPSVFDYPRPTSPGYFHTWHDTVLFILMCIFSVEIALRIIVSGLIFSPTTHWWVGTNNNKRSSSAPSASTPEKRRSNFFQTVTSPLAGNKHHGYQAPLARTRTDLSLDNKPQGTILSEVPFRLAVDHLQQITVSQKAYLRHSYNRIDLVAVVSFWITVALAATGVEHSKWLYIFRGLSVLRAARLLTFTTGSLIILHSLKRAGPSLLRVAFFFFFAMSLFAIVGVQSFNGSYRRECIWIDPAGQSNFSTGQICGSWFDEDNKRQIYLEENGQQAQGITWKGFACPQGQICLVNRLLSLSVRDQC